MGLAESLAKKVFARQIDELNTAIETIGMLLEAVAQLQDEERGWRLVGSDGTAELQPEAVREIMREAQEAWLRNPLAGQIVQVKRFFTLGAGISFTAEDSEVQNWLRRFWNDHANKMFLRQIEIFDSLQVYGELYIRFFEAPTGDVRVRLIPPIQIADIITDPEDIDTPIAFRREWTERRYKGNGAYEEIAHTGSNADEIPADDVFYVAINKPLGWKRGVSPLYRTLPWIKAYKEWLEDRAKINKAKTAFAWHKKIKGAGLTQMLNAAQKTASAIGGIVRNAIGGAVDTKPPKAGSVLVSNDQVEWELIANKIGADDASEDGRALKLMIAAGSNVFEHYFGDASVANLASAQAMELPMRKEFEWLQGLMAWIFRVIFRRVIQAGVRAGRLPEKIVVTKRVFRDGRVVEEKIEKPTEDCYIDVNFPPLRQEDIEKLTRALYTQQSMGIKSDRTIATELGVEDWEQEQALIEQEREIRRAREREDDTAKWPPFNPEQGGEE